MSSTSHEATRTTANNVALACGKTDLLTDTFHYIYNVNVVLLQLGTYRC